MKEMDIEKMKVFDFIDLNMPENINSNCFSCDSCDMCDSCDHGW